MTDRVDWERATRHQRQLAVAGDAELRRRHPAQPWLPLRSAGPEPAQQLLDAMTFLSFWSPSAFTAVLDYCEGTDWGWSGFDPDLISDPDGDDDPDDSSAPVCARCGGDLGIFLKFGLDWRHYRGEGLNDIELYDPGHAPELTWRAPAAPRSSTFSSGARLTHCESCLRMTPRAALAEAHSRGSRLPEAGRVQEARVAIRLLAGHNLG